MLRSILHYSWLTHPLPPQCPSHSQQAVQEVLVEALEPLISDPESVIRQHVASQLLHVSIVCMCNPDGITVQERLENPNPLETDFDEMGYELVTTMILDYLNTLLEDEDLDVRRVAAEALTGLAAQIQPDDVPAFCLPIPLRLALSAGPLGIMTPEKAVANKKKMSEADQQAEELRVTASNLLAELGGAASERAHLQGVTWVSEQILPAVLVLVTDGSFRVRRSAAQALPRILGACSLEDAKDQILLAFDLLSQDDLYRVRKSTGECLVDMSRSIMILASRDSQEGNREELYELRRSTLIPIADRLIQDSHKVVRQGMMQFLGPFMASFYPYQDSALRELLPTSTESDGSNHMGIVAQFFPHATSMVSRLNSAQNSVSTAPTPVQGNLQEVMARSTSEAELIQHAMPAFLCASRLSSLSLKAVTTHRHNHPPEQEDIDAIVNSLLDYFAALAIVTTGDANTDAEMRVYCAYSFPAVVLLLGSENWEGAMKTCFQTLINPALAGNSEAPAGPPLPVKRCLASSLHTVAHILGSDIASNDIIPVFQGFFLTDSDDSVRLNAIRNFPSLLQLVPAVKRIDPFQVWSEVVRGDAFLGAKKRSASNPVVLNWRQRDYLARSLPDLIGLVDPTQVHEHIWPVLQELLIDSVSIVRDDAIWSIPILLEAYSPDNCEKWHIEDSERFSSEACAEVIEWLKTSILRIDNPKKPANFSDRQLYCRICATVGLALRHSDMGADDKGEDPVSVLGGKFKTFFFGKSGEPDNAPYQKLTVSEQKHLKALLSDALLPPALVFKEDRISNVRITLMKTLQLMPADIKKSAQCAAVLKGLKEEITTWESFVGEEEQQATAQVNEKAKSDANAKLKKEPRPIKVKVKSQAIHRTGPVDVDEVELTPPNSRDEDEESSSEEVDDSGEDKVEEVAKPMDSGDSSEEEAEGVGAPVAAVEESAASDDEDSDSSGADAKETTFNASLDSRTGDINGAAASEWRTVVFEGGPIGMQLEPTVEDRACRVYGFVDSDESPSPARMSGRIQMGDVIVKVNGTAPVSYDETIGLLKKGGHREVVFRAGTRDDDFDEDYLATTLSDDGADTSDDDGDNEESMKAKKDAKKAKKAKKAEKKKKKDKKKDKEDDGDKKDKVEDDAPKKEKKEKKKKKEKKEKDGH